MLRNMSGGIPRYYNWDSKKTLSRAVVNKLVTDFSTTVVKRGDLELAGRENEIIANGCNEELMVIYVPGKNY